MRLRSSIILAVLLGALLCASQTQPRDGPLVMPLPNPDGIWQAPPHTTPTRRIDPVRVKNQADELAKLASGIPSDVGQVGKGLLPKELNDKLKRIEKLSKQLRQELVE